MAVQDIKMEHVVSDNIASVGYDEETQTLHVEFKKSGALYEYENVPPYIYQGLLTAGSVGEYFASSVKGSYKYRRL